MSSTKSFDEIREALGLEDFTKFKLKAVAQFREQRPQTVLTDSEIVKEIPCGKTTLLLVSVLHHSQFVERIYVKGYNDLITEVLVNKVKNYANRLCLNDENRFYGLRTNQYLFVDKKVKLFIDHYKSELFDYEKWITHT